VGLSETLSGTLHLAQAQSNRGPGGRKKDFPDAERLVKRLVAQELTLSFVPDAEQRLWRAVMRRKYQITRNRVQLHNRLEALLEEARIKVSSLVSDLLGLSARRMLQALADGETDPAALAALAAPRLRATPEQLCDAFHACPTLHPVYRRLLKLTLEELRLIEDHLGQLDQQMADCSPLTTTRSAALPRSPDSASIPRSRSLRRWAPRRPRFRHPSISPPGWAPAPATRKAPASTTAIAARKAIAKCVASSTRPRTRR
jgi:hypothetical protein